jgi:arsenite methyltransferase
MITQEESLKAIVREKYAEIANQSAEFNSTSCCGSGPSTGSYTIMSESYDHLKGYNSEADLSLGCGLPTQFANIKIGDIVIDLGSGAGNDCFVARAETGETGKIIGIDFTKAMIEKARNNAEKLGYNNVEFREGDIDNMPVNDNVADVIVSNCVLNLVPDKQKVISEIFRVLKPKGHFSISDIVLEGGLPIEIQNAAEMYAGCVSGAIQKSEYLKIIKETGFTNITIQKDRRIFLPDEILLEYLTPEALKIFLDSKMGIFSITVYAEKPGISNDSSPKKKIKLSEITQETPCCTPGGGCC